MCNISHVRMRHQGECGTDVSAIRDRMTENNHSNIDDVARNGGRRDQTDEMLVCVCLKITLSEPYLLITLGVCSFDK